MRKATKYFITAAWAVITLAGCSNEGNEPNVNGRKDCPDFTATIGSVQSRAFDQSWESGDEIGITGANRTNVSYITNNGNGNFTVKTQGSQIYFQDDSEVTFTAYYPYNALEGGASTINADTKVQTNQKGFDFLWAQASGKKDAPNVSFNFSHKMAKVVFTVKPGDGMSYDEIKAASLSLGGFSHTGSFSINNGNTAVNGNAAADWVFTGGVAPVTYNDNEKTATFSLIFFPQKFGNPLAFLAELNLSGKILNLRADVDFTSANREKDGANAKNEWVAGRQYNLSLILNKTNITLSECVINPWNVVTTGEDITVD